MEYFFIGQLTHGTIDIADSVVPGCTMETIDQGSWILGKFERTYHDDGAQEEHIWLLAEHSPDAYEENITEYHPLIKSYAALPLKIKSMRAVMMDYVSILPGEFYSKEDAIIMMYNDIAKYEKYEIDFKDYMKIRSECWKRMIDEAEETKGSETADDND